MIKGFEVTCQIVWLSSLYHPRLLLPPFLCLSKDYIHYPDHRSKKGCFLSKKRVLESVCLNKKRAAGDIICNTVLLSLYQSWVVSGEFQANGWILCYYKERFLCWKNYYLGSYSFFFRSFFLPLVIQGPLKRIKAEHSKSRVFSFPLLSPDLMNPWHISLQTWFSWREKGRKMQEISWLPFS